MVLDPGAGDDGKLEAHSVKLLMPQSETQAPDFAHTNTTMPCIALHVLSETNRITQVADQLGFDYFTSTQAELRPASGGNYTGASPGTNDIRPLGIDVDGALPLPGSNGAQRTVTAPVPRKVAAAVPKDFTRAQLDTAQRPEAGNVITPLVGHKRPREGLPQRENVCKNNIDDLGAYRSRDQGGEEEMAGFNPAGDGGGGQLGFEGFSTGTGRKLQVSEATLKAARRMLENVEAEMDAETHRCDKTPRREGGTPVVYDLNEARTLPPMPPAGGALLGGFSTGTGKKLRVSPSKLLAARRLLDDEPEDARPDATDTPTVREQVLQNKPAPVPVPDRHQGTTGSRLSRFAPPAAHAALQQTRGGKKFNTPRPAPINVRAAPFTRQPEKENVHSLQQIQQTGTPSAKPMHTLSPTSAVKKALQAPTTTDGPTKSHPAISISQLPLDSLDAVNYQLFSGNGVRVGRGELWGRLLSAGAVPSQATEEWVGNHYRWVIWKLARLVFATLMGPRSSEISLKAARILSIDTVEDELKRRYEREFNRGHRPLLKSILQHDEPAHLPMVLLVASIRTQPSGGARPLLELTDGWYWVMAACDDVLAGQIAAGKIGIGTKLRIVGASLTGSGPGEPLLAARSALLQLQANGTHPAPKSSDTGIKTAWKLGRQCSRTTYVPLGAVRPDGGPIPQTMLVICRRYPRLLWTRLPSGVGMFQTPRAHAKIERHLAQDVETAQITATNEVMAAEQHRCRDWLANGKADGMKQVDRWYAEMMTCGDTEDFMASLNPRDRLLLQKYTENRQVDLYAEIQRATKAALAADTPTAPVPSSTEMATFLVGEVVHASAGSASKALLSNRRRPTLALLTVWRPAEDLAHVREGEVYAISGLEPKRRAASTTRPVTLPPPLFPDALLRLDAGPRCHWRRVAGCVVDLPRCLVAHAMPRAVADIADMPAIASAAAEGGQQSAVFDASGLILRSGPRHSDVSDDLYPHFQWVFLIDRSSSMKRNTTRSGSATSVPDDIADGEDWVLAVRLQGAADAVNWVGREDEGCVVSISDLEFVGRDDPSKVWRAAGGKHSSLTKLRGEGLSRGEAAALMAWSKENGPTVEALGQRIDALLAGG